MVFEISIWAVLISAALMMPLGAFVYSEKGLGKQWMKAIGKTREDIEASNSNMGLLMGVALGSSIVTVLLVNVLISSVGVMNAVDLLVVVFSVYLVVFFVRLKGTVFDDNFALFKVNLIATLGEFIIIFVVFLFFI